MKQLADERQPLFNRFGLPPSITSRLLLDGLLRPPIG